MNQAVHNRLISFIWSIADDCLRDVYVRGKYRDVILPMVVLRRLDALLEPTKEAVMEELAFQRDEAGFTESIVTGKNISPAHLMCPLDVHSGRTARKLGLLNRKQDDWKAVEELTANLRTFDANDPVKYDFALFGISVSQNKYK